MAVSTAYVIQANSYSAQDFRDAASSLLPVAARGLNSAVGGVVNNADLFVSAGSGNSVNVAAGEGWVGGSVNAAQACYYCYNDALVNLSITPNGSNPLYAIVTLSVNDQAYSGNPGVPNNTGGLLVTQGTPAGSPTVPATPNNSLLLAKILVPAGAASSASYTITDERVSASAKPAGRMYDSSPTNFINGTRGIIANPTPDFLYGGMTFSSGSKALVVPITGIYRAAYQLSFEQLSAASRIQVVFGVNGTYFRALSAWADNDVSGYGVGGSSLIKLAAGDTLTVGGTQSGGTDINDLTGTQYTFLDVSLDQETP